MSHYERYKPRAWQDLTGRQFGRYTVIKLVEKIKKPPFCFWLVSCPCGFCKGEKTLSTDALKKVSKSPRCHPQQAKYGRRGVEKREAIKRGEIMDVTLGQPKPKIRFCRECLKQLPPSRYFHHDYCAPKVTFHDFSDDYSLAIPSHGNNQE